MPSREPPLEPRLVATVPECVPPWRHTLDEDSPADEIVSRAGDGCGVVVSSTKRRWHYHRPASQTGQGGACSRSARNRRSPPLPRPEQRRVDGSPFEVGRRESTRGSRAESQPHAPRACTPPSQGEKILSARRAGQAGRRAGSGKTIPRLARDATRPSREAVRRAPPTHARLASTPRKTRGRPLTRLPSGPRDGGGESLRSRIEVRTRQVA